MQLSQAEITQQSQQHYLMSGVVDFSTAPVLLQLSADFFTALKSMDNKNISMDLSQVSECNSAALALMLEIVKNARQKDIAIHFENPPEVVLTIAKAYGVENEIRELCE